MKRLELGIPSIREVSPPLPSPIILTEADMADQKKAEKDGVYVLNGASFRIRAGKPLPEGAVFRAKDAKPENKARTTPQNKAETEPESK